MRGSEEERCTGSDSKGIKTREKIKGKRKNTLPSAGDKYQLVQKKYSILQKSYTIPILLVSQNEQMLISKFLKFCMSDF